MKNWMSFFVLFLHNTKKYAYNTHIDIDKYAYNAYNNIVTDNYPLKGVSHMKRRDLIKLLETNGWYLKRSGGNHDLYTDGERTEPIPRHSEIKEMLAKNIIKKLGL